VGSAPKVAPAAADTGSAPTAASRSAPAPRAAGVAARSAVFRIPTPMAGERTLGAADRDTAVRAIGRGLPAFPRLAPTQALHDSAAHEATQELSLRADATRPPPIPFVAQGGFSRRVRARRMRDSVLHEANLERLRRIADSSAARRSPQ
jgi:hypothetical protein